MTVNSMRRKIIISVACVGVLAVVLLGVKSYLFPAPAPAIMLGAKSYSVAESSLADLLANEDTRALLDEHLAGVSDIHQLEVAKPLTLEDIQPFYPNLISSANLPALDALLREVKSSGIEVYNSASTLVGILLDDPEARAILDTHLPGFSTNPEIDQGRGFTLSFMQKFDTETMTNEILANIDADFKKLAEQRAGSI